jgi:hypothetical protein
VAEGSEVSLPCRVVDFVGWKHVRGEGGVRARKTCHDRRLDADGTRVPKSIIAPEKCPIVAYLSRFCRWHAATGYITANPKRRRGEC